MNEDRSARYHRLRRRAALLSTVLGVAALVLLFTTPASRSLAGWAVHLTSAFIWPLRPVAAVLCYAGVLVLGWETASFPFALYRTFLLDRKYGLSSEPFATWFRDHLKALGLGVLLTLVSAVAVYVTIWLSPRWWWALTAVLFIAAAVLMSRIAPIWLMPIFYRFRPLERETLRERLLTLSQRARVPVLGVFEWVLGEKTSRANAALVGAGRTRRILLSDTLLEDYSDDEIEVILAHELAHHVHHDLWTALALEAFVVTAALFAAHAVTTRAAQPLALRGPGDLAALPLMVLVMGVVSRLLAPITNAWSRHNERRADRFALALTERPAAFVSAMKRLGAQNLADERPSRLVYWFFHTHPTIEERIAAASALPPTPR